MVKFKKMHGHDVFFLNTVATNATLNDKGDNTSAS